MVTPPGGEIFKDAHHHNAHSWVGGENPHRPPDKGWQPVGVRALDSQRIRHFYFGDAVLSQGPVKHLWSAHLNFLRQRQVNVIHPVEAGIRLTGMRAFKKVVSGLLQRGPAQSLFLHGVTVRQRSAAGETAGLKDRLSSRHISNETSHVGRRHSVKYGRTWRLVRHRVPGATCILPLDQKVAQTTLIPVLICEKAGLATC
mmetsp:Transcript_22908/g.43792  ORF Transcript_22908/g.43792 Transcript_22908/m.43792 type:complete len:200 (+) Transcript_22908:1414-2013(+)